MLQLRNETPFAAAITLLPDREGVDTLYTVVKGTFGVGPRGVAVDEPLPIVPADVHHGDPAASSVRLPSDICLGKPGTDVLLLGSAWAPRGRPTTWMDVSLACGPVSKLVRVFGDRVWHADAAGGAASSPAPFERMPLVWERAFGGGDATEAGPTVEPRNPVGQGFRVSDGMKSLDGMRLPNLEDPMAPITSPTDRPPPACFAPIAPHWEPRRSFAGTYDEQWQRTRAPYLPADFDARFFQVAPPGLATTAPLEGGEWVDVRGATPEGILQFQLPRVRLEVAHAFDSGVEVRDAALDTVLVFSDDRRVTLVWRSALRCDKRALRARDVRVAVAS